MKLKQLVIIAGGRGTRMEPLSSVIPKPLIRINGKTFLWHLIRNGKKFGFTDFVVLTGYKSEMFDAFENELAELDVKISIIPSDPDLSPLERLRTHVYAYNELFTVAYSDNLIQETPIERKHFESFNSGISFLAYQGIGYHRKRNVKLDEFGNFEDYLDKPTTNFETHVINLGWINLEKKYLSQQENTNKSLENYLLSRNKSDVKCTVTNNLYYSIGTLDRIAKTSQYLDEGRRVIFLDRDGTLNQRAPKAEYVLNKKDFKWINNSVEGLELCNKLNLEVYVITNQPAVARGLVTKASIDGLHSWLIMEAARNFGRIDAIFACMHGWDEGCKCRKPGVGLFQEAQHIYDINLNNSVYIGDDSRDKQAADRLGIRFIGVESQDFDLKSEILDWLRNGANK